MNESKPLLSDLVDYLHAHFIAVASTVSPAGKPQCATVFYWANDVTPTGFSIYFVTRRSTRKFQNLLANAAISVVVGTEFEPNSVQVEGNVEVIEVADKQGEMAEFTKRMTAHPNLAQLYSGAFFPRNPFVQMEGSDFAVIRVVPTWVRWMRYDAQAKKIVYHQVIG